jgi:DNA-directed RNA polymerase subunit omega
MSINNDGMRYPSIDELLEVVNSKYKLAFIAAKRAKKIQFEGTSLEEHKCVKPVGIALEEVLAGKIEVEFEEKVEI